MNKYLRNNWKVFNAIRFYPMETPPPEGLSNINEWCEKVWNHLENDDVKREAYFCYKGKKGFTISVLSDNEYVYIVQCVRTETNTDDTAIFMQPLTDNNVNDFKAMAKFLRYSGNSIVNNFKQGWKAFNQLKSAEELQKEFEGKTGEA